MEFILHHTVKLLKLIILNGKHENKIVTKCNIHRIIKNVKKMDLCIKIVAMNMYTYNKYLQYCYTYRCLQITNIHNHDI